MKLQETLTKSISRTILKSKKNSPHFLFVAGVVGIVGSAILACRSTLKLEETLDDIKTDLTGVKSLNVISNGSPEYIEKDYYRDLVYVYGKSAAKFARLYGPSIVLGSVSIAALTASHVELSRRNSALTATLAAVSQAYDEYRDRVKKEVGEKRELELFHGVHDEQIEIDGKKELAKVVDANGRSPYARIFERHNINWQPNTEINRIFIQCQQNYANHQLKSRGHVFLNDVYDSLGMERSRAGAVVGWVNNGEGDGYVDFGLYDIENVHFVNGNACGALLDFNVDGIVYDKI